MNFSELEDMNYCAAHDVYGACQFCVTSGLADGAQVGGSHYKEMEVTPWQVMEAVLTHEQFIGFLRGNVIKYSMRAGKKEGSDDAGKAKHYIAKLREMQGMQT